MKIKIGFITSEPFVPFIEPLRPDIENYCDFNILTIKHFIDVVECYDIFSAQKMDCIILSGQTLYHLLEQKRGTPEIPCYSLDETQGDFKSIFLDLLLENRQFDFRRVYLDFAMPINDFQGIKELLPEDQWPFFNDQRSDDLVTFIDQTYEKHLQLHQTKAIDVSITRFGTFCADLDTFGYRNIYVFPPKVYFFNFIIQVINAVQQKSSQDQLPSCIKIMFGTVDETKHFEIVSEIENYFKNDVISQKYNLNIQPYEDHIEIVTTFNYLDEITDGMRDTHFFDDLMKICPMIFAIGLGTGINIFSARENASKSVHFSFDHPKDIYFVNQSNIRFGPVGSEDRMKVIGKPNSQLLILSERFGINHIHLQKIISLTQLMQSSLVTGSQLSEYLGVTTRSANRFLKQIEDAGGAYSYHEKITEGRGRPVKYYELSFIKDLRNTVD